MKTHARRGEAGFSFVELLVTIIIAGIAFAAMVPLFVQAQKQTSADNMRNVTMQVAQQKIEKIRQLDYDQITQANLDDEGFADGEFGNTYVYRGGSGATRDLTVTYVVALVPDTLPDGTSTPEGREYYKQVQVEVTWTGPPDPVRAARLTTTIYRQFAGAAIRVFDVGPSSIFQTVSGKTTINGAPIVLDAYIAAEDIDGMNADLGDPTIPENRRRMGYVEFTISSTNGFGPVRNKVYLPVTGEPGHYRYTWNNAAVVDGIYLFEAVAVSGTQQKGPSVSVAYEIARAAPPRPTGLSFIPGDGVVYLSWDASPVGDLDHYEVYRSLDGSTYELIADELPAPSFTDTGLTNDIPYYYYVCAVDYDDYRSAPSSAITAVPRIVSDSAPPSSPTNLTASPVPNTPTVTLQWDASVDADSGVRGYTIERSANQVDWQEIQGGYAPTNYIDTTAGWGATWYYRVQAIDNAGNASAWTSVGPVTTPALPARTLMVINGQNLNAKAWVQNVTTGLYYSRTGVASATKPSGVPVSKLGGSALWESLPAGIYNVTNDGGYPTHAVDLTYGNGSVTI